jgi:lipoprotein LprG
VRHRSPVPVLLSALAAALVLAGCSSGGAPAEQLPPAPQLLTQAADAMAKVRTVSLDAQVDPKVSGLPVRSAAAKLTAAGDATGTAALNQGGEAIELQFVATKGTLFIKGPTGNWQPIPLALAAGIYDPSALLRPDSGVAALLRTARDGVTEASEDVGGRPAYRVRATLDRNALQSIVPGIAADSGVVWLDKADSRMLKAVVDVPTTAGDPQSPKAPVTVTLTDFDAPVAVTPPA